MPEAPRRVGVFESLRGGAATLLALARVRLDLFATELQEEKNRAGLVLLFGAGPVLFLSFGLFFLAGPIPLLLWGRNRLLALADRRHQQAGIGDQGCRDHGGDEPQPGENGSFPGEFFRKDPI